LRVAGLVSKMMSACTALATWSGVERASKRGYISINNEITVFVEIGERLGFASCRDRFDDEVGVHCVRRVEWSGKNA
jgi:hypothetical protein